LFIIEFIEEGDNMAVYIDDMYTISLGNFRGMKMSHMAADSHEELIEFAKKIGVNKKWIQHKGEGKEHFDIAKGKREVAIRAGAIPVGMRILCSAMVARKSPNEKLDIK
jgi:hypothetical protein